ncbi:acyltransferase family protein [Raoultella ornithinolytica]|nr:acyltransferase [Raoultella ornithinolytica]
MFRLDINGLRFIAVTMVVLFHFKIGHFYGGYAGVDVFFVISGFLMNEICRNKIGTKGWIINFYQKRFKRIYPALIACVLFSFLLAIVSTPPSMLKSLFYQVASSLTFTSNLYYLKATSGYFTDAADSFIFLHTWSLSVEWQFYLIFPFVLLFSNIFSKNNNGCIFYGFIISLSLCACILLTHYNQTYSFYLLPSRAWELMIGAMASSITLKNRFPKITEIAALVVLIAFTAVVKESLSWPGVETLIPTVATALLLHANVGNEKTILRAKPLQLIGSSSYSIYLFHWPIVSLFYLNKVEFNAVNQFVGIFISFILGLLSYFYIEKKNKLPIAGLAGFAIALSVLAFSISKFNASKYWMSDSILAMDKFHSYGASKEGIYQFGNDGRVCFLTSEYNSASQFDEDKCLVNNGDKNKPRLLLIGDSHAAEYYAAAKELYKNYLVMQVTSSGCMPFVNSKGERRCIDLMDKFYQSYLKKYNINTVLISANWNDGKKFFSKNEMADNLINSVEYMKSYAKNVYVIGQTKVYDTAFYRIAQLNDLAKIKRHELNGPSSLNDFLKSRLISKDVDYIDLYGFECEDEQCYYISEDGYPIMFDNNHFTLPWAKKLLGEVMIRTEVEPLTHSK